MCQCVNVSMYQCVNVSTCLCICVSMYHCVYLFFSDVILYFRGTSFVARSLILPYSNGQRLPPTANLLDLDPLCAFAHSTPSSLELETKQRCSATSGNGDNGKDGSHRTHRNIHHVKVGSKETTESTETQQTIGASSEVEAPEINVALKNSFGFGGTNASIVLRVFKP